MNKTVWTDEQRLAIEARDCSLLVSAAAGAGKTAVLVERIIRSITDENSPVDIDRLLVVTFTKAAAAEMRERISAAVARALNENPASTHLNRQLILLNRASVTTLHSFCLEILRQYFYRLDLDPSFRVADDTEAALLRLEALEELFEEYYGAEDPDFLALVDAYGGDREDTMLQDMVLKLHRFAASSPWPEEWLNSLVTGYTTREGLPPGDLPWGSALLDWLDLQLEGCLIKLARARRYASAPAGPAIYLETLANDTVLVEDLIKAGRISWQALYEAANHSEFGKLRTCKDKDVDDLLKKRVQRLRDQVKKTVKDMRECFFSRPPGDLSADLARVAPMARTLVELALAFDKKYAQAKTAKSLLDFSDLEHYCLRILMDEVSSPGKAVPSAAAYELREHFAEVLVDEYQDINAVQETILQLVSREETATPNRFMVGDVKQSIYRFRLADPSLFMEKYQSYPREAGSLNRGIDLTRNFRSRREIIETVNFIFRQLMSARVGEITYDDKAELICGAGYPPGPAGVKTAAGPAELFILEKPPADGTASDEYGDETAEADSMPGGGEEEELDTVQREARLLACRIREMVTGTEDRPGAEFHVYDRKSGGYRPVRYGDIVVLLRAARNSANTFLEEFRLAGIPAYANLETGYFAAVEVETMLSLLKIIDNPRQDIPLAGVLRSPVVGLSAGDLALIRTRANRGDYYDALLLSAQAGESAADLKVGEFLASLDRWRTMARRGPLSELIWRLYDETGYYAYAGGMPAGAQRQANMRALYDRARQFEATTFRGLFRFLRFLEKFQESGSDMGSARAMGEGDDVVRVMSIHKSKGLEFPIVMAAGLGRQFNTSDLRDRALLHQGLGLGLPVVDRSMCLSYPTIAHQAIAKKLYMELLAEEMRILYVALTRAKEKLVLAGTVSNLDKSATTWCDNLLLDTWTLPGPDLAAARCFLDWICPAVARHPDGTVLRHAAGYADDYMPALTGVTSGWNVSIISGETAMAVPPGTTVDNSGLIEHVRSLEPVQVEDRYTSIINARFNWRYPFHILEGKPAKVTVTELKRRFADDGTVAVNAPPKAVRPQFLQKTTGLSPAEYGSAVHLVMQYVDIGGDLSETGLCRQLDQMVSRELLTSEQAAAVSIPALIRFFTSPLGLRMTAAADIKKEVPFTMALPVSEVFTDTAPGTGKDTGAPQLTDRVLVQGIIDCLIDEGDGYVLLDYKTDNLLPEEAWTAASRYRKQLDLYARAVETILGRPVKEKYLYLFAAGQAVKCGG